MGRYFQDVDNPPLTSHLDYNVLMYIEMRDIISELMIILIL